MRREGERAAAAEYPGEDRQGDSAPEAAADRDPADRETAGEAEPSACSGGRADQGEQGDRDQLGRGPEAGKEDRGRGAEVTELLFESSPEFRGRAGGRETVLEYPRGSGVEAKAGSDLYPGAGEVREPENQPVRSFQPEEAEESGRPAGAGVGVQPDILRPAAGGHEVCDYPVPESRRVAGHLAQ